MRTFERSDDVSSSALETLLLRRKVQKDQNRETKAQLNFLPFFWKIYRNDNAADCKTNKPCARTCVGAGEHLRRLLLNAICLCAALVIYIRYTIGWWSTLNSLMRKRNKEKVVRVSAQLDSVANSNLHYLPCAGNLSGIPGNELCISWQSGVGILDTVLELHSPRCTCSRLTSFLPPPFPSPKTGCAGISRFSTVDCSPGSHVDKPVPASPCCTAAPCFGGW